LVGREDMLEWVRTTRLAGQPLTGLARKVLQRLDVMEVRPVVWGRLPAIEAQEGEVL
jgi:A/G-specific adenine glycosylase